MGSDNERSTPELKKPAFHTLTRVFGFLAIAAAVGWVVFATASAASLNRTQPATQPSLRTGTLQVGSPAPEFHLLTLDGRDVSLSGFRGKPLVLNFFASWCDPCKEELPFVKTMAADAAAAGYAVLGVAIQDERAALNQLISEEGLAMPVSMDLDGKVTHDYGVIGPPTTFFIDSTGTIRNMVMGPLNDERVLEGLTAAHQGNGLATSSGSSALDGVGNNLLAGLALALGAGLLSFLSPCVLPLLPAYMGYIAGLSSELQVEKTGTKTRLPVLYRTTSFTLGLVGVFTVLGFSASFIGTWLTDYRTLLARIGGLLVLVFGLHMLGILPVRLLFQEYRPALNDRKLGSGGGILSAGALGAAFAVGWTPCVGPMLGTILLLAGQVGQAGTGASLLMAYGLGLGIPFVVAGLTFSRALGAVAVIKRHLGLIEKVSGALLIATAILMISGSLSSLTVWLQRVF